MSCRYCPLLSSQPQRNINTVSISIGFFIAPPQLQSELIPTRNTMKDAKSNLKFYALFPIGNISFIFIHSLFASLANPEIAYLVTYLILHTKSQAVNQSIS